MRETNFDASSVRFRYGPPVCSPVSQRSVEVKDCRAHTINLHTGIRAEQTEQIRTHSGPTIFSERVLRGCPLCSSARCFMSRQLIEIQMTLTIYGSHQSRTMRVLWMAAELGLTFEHVALEHNDPKLKQSEFLQINPTGTIPTIVDDGFALSESLAINLYLGKKYGRVGSTPLYPNTLNEEADIWRWSLWANTHIEPWVQNDGMAAGLRAAIDENVQSATEPAIRILNTALTRQPWLIGKHFTVGDINVAGVLSPSRAKKIDMPEPVNDFETPTVSIY